MIKPRAAFESENKIFSPRRILSRKNFRFEWKSRFVSKIRRKNWPLLSNWKKRVPRGILVGDRQLWNEREMDFDVGDNGREEVL